MPQLEIHHADGNVSYAQLSPDKPALVGSAPKCDVILKSSDVRSIHCRIIWREDRWRLEVAADAGSVYLKDKLVKAGTIQSGDVITIGEHRIYLDDARKAGAAPVPAALSPFHD